MRSQLTPNDYLDLFDSAKLTEDRAKLKELDFVCRVIVTNDMIYKTVERFTCIPWFLIAALHSRESGQNFTKHLHNGDPLAARTVHVPQGRPVYGQPPYTWIESAVDALDGAWTPPIWNLAGALEFLERYNGFGYQKHGIHSPYLWDYTDKYSKGLFVADGKFDPEKIERRPGCVAIVKTLAIKGVPLEFTVLAPGSGSLH